MYQYKFFYDETLVGITHAVNDFIADEAPAHAWRVRFVASDDGDVGGVLVVLECNVPAPAPAPARSRPLTSRDMNLPDPWDLHPSHPKYQPKPDEDD